MASIIWCVAVGGDTARDVQRMDYVATCKEGYWCIVVVMRDISMSAVVWCGDAIHMSPPSALPKIVVKVYSAIYEITTVHVDCSENGMQQTTKFRLKTVRYSCGFDVLAEVRNIANSRTSVTYVTYGTCEGDSRETLRVESATRHVGDILRYAPEEKRGVTDAAVFRFNGDPSKCAGWDTLHCIPPVWLEYGEGAKRSSSLAPQWKVDSMYWILF